MRRRAALGDCWHVGIVTALAEETRAVLDVFGIVGGRRFHTGRMAVPGGVTYLVATPPVGPDGVGAALGDLCGRYDPPVIVLVGGGRRHDVVVASGREPVDGALVSFFAASGEPATLPGHGGVAPFRVVRGAAADHQLSRFCLGATTRHGRPVAWLVVRSAAARNAAQALRYLIPYLRPRL